jgi:hypothetical protein
MNDESGIRIIIMLFIAISIAIVAAFVNYGNNEHRCISKCADLISQKKIDTEQYKECNRACHAEQTPTQQN